MYIHIVQKHELDRLLDIARSTFIETFADLNDPQDFTAYVDKYFTAEQLEKEFNTEGSRFYLAEIEGVTIGYCKININRSPLQTDNPKLYFDFTEYADKTMTEIERIYLKPEYQGKGLAEQMLVVCKYNARKFGSTHIWLGVWEKNKKAIRFYEKMDFDVIGEHVFKIGDDEQRDILMWENLV